MPQRSLNPKQIGPLENVRVLISFLVDRSKETDEIRYSEIKKIRTNRGSATYAVKMLVETGLAKRKYTAGIGKAKGIKASILRLHDKPKLIKALEEIDLVMKERDAKYKIKAVSKTTTEQSIDFMMGIFSKPPIQRANHG